jgi:hypothetical protein
MHKICWLKIRMKRLLKLIEGQLYSNASVSHSADIEMLLKFFDLLTTHYCLRPCLRSDTHRIQAVLQPLPAIQLMILKLFGMFSLSLYDAQI